MTRVHCQNCGIGYPLVEMPFLCPTCSGTWDQAELPQIDLKSVENIPGIWRYRHTFEDEIQAGPISLGEGGTPLIPDRLDNRDIFFKLESLNPTGSYKDRASAVLINYLHQRNIETAVEDSSGNAGASFAAYAARAGIKARIFVPAAASGPKRRQIELYGADLIAVDGPRSAAADAVLKEASRGTTYASHAYMPFGMDGIATIAYEIFECLGELPGTVIGPAGHGSFMLGVGRGFQALLKQGYSSMLPVLIAVQSAACAPIKAARGGTHDDITEKATLAEGVRVRHPVRSKALLNVIREAHGMVEAVEEEDILPARDELAGRGLYVEPTSVLPWVVAKRFKNTLPEPVVILLSGTGFKYNA